MAEEQDLQTTTTQDPATPRTDSAEQALGPSDPNAFNLTTEEAAKNETTDASAVNVTQAAPEDQPPEIHESVVIPDELKGKTPIPYPGHGGRFIDVGGGWVIPIDDPTTV